MGGLPSTYYFEYAAKYQEKIQRYEHKTSSEKGWLGRLNAGYDFNGRFLNGVFKKIVPIAGDSSLRSERRATF